MLRRLALCVAVFLVHPRSHDARDSVATLEGTVLLPEFVPRAKSQRYPGIRPPGEYLRGPAIVFIDGVPGDFPAPKEPVVLGQKERQFIPLILPVLKGSIVSFPNNDDEYHNVFSRSSAKEIELGRYPKTDREDSIPKVTFDRPGIVRLRCEIHANMHAVVVVLQNPCFTTCDSEGRFTIQGIPPGKYKAYAFQEDYLPDDPKGDPLRAVCQEVEVVADRATKAEFDLRKKK